MYGGCGGWRGGEVRLLGGDGEEDEAEAEGLMSTEGAQGTVVHEL